LAGLGESDKAASEELFEINELWKDLGQETLATPAVTRDGW
jgi:hypothetical protein